jgi:hypothetical protein
MVELVLADIRIAALKMAKSLNESAITKINS